MYFINLLKFYTHITAHTLVYLLVKNRLLHLFDGGYNYNVDICIYIKPTKVK